MERPEDEVDEDRDEEEDEAEQSATCSRVVAVPVGAVVSGGGMTVRAEVWLLEMLDLFVLVLINGESSINASVFFKSSKVNEQLESFGVIGAPIEWLLDFRGVFSFS